MQTLLAAYNSLKESLLTIYNDGEASFIAHEIMEHITGYNKLQRLTKKEEHFTIEQEAAYTKCSKQLLTGIPMQYVIGHTWFMGHKYIVNSNVLIPRPETEELVQLIADDWKNKQDITILDIGTGSGCIPISLKQLLPQANVNSCDVSEGALSTAQQNAAALNTDVNFMLLDFLDEIKQATLKTYDIIVSNPPYIPVEYKEQMDSNVKDFEPEVALFVPNNDPLLFYRAIAIFGQKYLTPQGAIYCELHADHALATEQLFLEMGYKHVTIKKDMHGNLRILKAQ
ncbi:MAG: peptide chain release factor N(5)-glutamine methyltransferase [Flavipsychrobacter sp.]